MTSVSSSRMGRQEPREAKRAVEGPGAALRPRSDCRGCGSSLLDLFVDLGQVPLAGGFVLEHELRSVQRFPLRVYHCLECDLVQVVDVVSPDQLFRHYLYQSSTTETLRAHFAEQAHAIAAHFDNYPTDLVVEIGCNDGVLLAPLAERGFRVLGVDPARNVTDIARGRGFEVLDEYFTRESAENIRTEYGPASAVVANNVLAHIDDMDSVLDGVRTLLRRDGILVFEVHYLGDLIRLNQFDTIYHEHLCYYSVRSLARMLDRFGFEIVCVEPIPIHSGSIRVWARAHPRPGDRDESVARYLHAEEGLDYANFGGVVERCRYDIRATLDLNTANGERVVGYGAPGRGTILLNYCGIDRKMLPYVTDESSLRQGRFIPGVDIPIVAPDRLRAEKPEYALLLAWNYEAEVLRKESDYRDAGGRFIIPLPSPRVS